MIKFDSPLAAFLHWEATVPDNVFLRQPFSRQIKEYTYKSAGDEVRRMASALKALNMPPKSHVAIISKNCAHWIMADLAIMMAGYVSIPIYATLNSESIRLVLEHSESKAVFIGKLDDYAAQKPGIPDIHKIGVRAYGIDETLTWEDIIEQYEPLHDMPLQNKDDLLTIIYTSGTTGTPKGVMHTIGNMAQFSNTMQELIVAPEHPRGFSYLPLSHIAERVGIEFQSLYRGAVINFPESLETFAEDLAATQPDIFFAVPRIWSKFQEKILEKMPQKKLDKLLRIPILGSLVKKKIAKKLGLSNAVYIVSAAAPIAVSVLEWYKKLGIIIHQGYGMTEDCVLSHFNLVGANKIGSVGKPLPGATVKLSSEAEICIKSDALMKGYYKEPEMTAAMFDEEGFLKTGDIGEYDDEGYLTITGRIKDQFKTDKGKYISPAPIELELNKNPDIEQACIVGMGIPQPIALVVPSANAKTKSKESLYESLTQSISQLNYSLEKFEKIDKAVIMKEEWSIENGLLTPTLKLKRNQVEKIHTPMYKTWYENEEKVVYE